jgi:hypothetical protein
MKRRGNNNGKPSPEDEQLIIRQFKLKGDAARRFKDHQRKLNIDTVSTVARKLILDQLNHLDAAKKAA